MISVEKNPSRQVLHSFGWAMLGGFAVLGVLLWGIHAWRNETALFAWTGAGAQVAAVVCWGAGVILLAVSRGPGSVARPVYVTWMTAAMTLGMVMTTVLFTVLFVVLLPVFSLIRFGDPLRTRLKDEGTYWEDHKRHEATLERTARPF